MNPSIIFLILTGIIIWVIQCIFGFFQLKNFQKNFSDMRKEGKVAIGFTKGFFFSGSVILIGLKKDNAISEIRYMQGVTILARCRKLKGFENKNFENITEEDFRHLNKILRKAFKKAIENYNQFKKDEISKQDISLEIDSIKSVNQG